MATVIKPLMSDFASGTIGHALQFQPLRGRTTAGRRRRPKQPRTEAQRATRLFMKWLCAQWSGLSIAELASWQNCDDYGVLPAYNKFVKYNINRIKNLPSPTNYAGDFHQWPSTSYPAPENTTTWSYANRVWTPGVHQLTFTFDVKWQDDAWLLPIFRISAQHPKPAYASLVHIEPIPADGSYEIVITNLPAGEQTFKYARLPRSGLAYLYFSSTTQTILDD